MSTTDDIKSKIDLAEYLREQGVELKAAGQSLKACCPFHNEKTPSFMVNREKQVWYCFGCSRGGDLFTFVQEREGLEFPETLKLLAERAGVPLEDRDPRLEGKRTRALSVLDAAVAFFQQQLARSDVAQRYVTMRRVAPAMLEQFQLGYAPDRWDALTTYLLQRGFTAQALLDAGLAIPSRTSAIGNPEPARTRYGVGRQSAIRAYDRFRHRLMFPIHDAMGRVVGFTGRILEGGTTTGEHPAKYINTPETDLYKKHAILYGLAFAKQVIRTAGYVVLVEGNMDVITSHGAGFVQTVATSGTALSAAQLTLLKRYTSTLHIAFDADPAGQGAAERGIDAALDAGFDVRVVAMPTDASGASIAKDPDECIGRDAAGWRSAVEHPIPVLDAYLERVQRQYDCSTPAGQRDAGRIIVRHLAHVSDAIERAAWVKRAAETIGVPEAAVREAVERSHAAPRSSVGRREAVRDTTHVVDPSERLANRLLALLCRNPDFLAAVRGVVRVDNFPQPHQRVLYKMLPVGYTGDQNDTVAPLSDSVDQGPLTATEVSRFRERLELFADREFVDLSPDVLRAEALRCARELRRRAITTQLQGVSSRLRAIERSSTRGNHERAELTHLEQQFRELTNELASLTT